MKVPPGTPRHRWEDIIKMDLKEVTMVGCELKTFVKMVMNPWVP
jgi:hypothetical protein